MIDRDPQASFAELHACAEDGDPEAHFTLGVLYAKGIRVPRDLLQAYAWLSLAIAQDHPEAGAARASIARELTSSALIDARDLARRYFDAYFRSDTEIPQSPRGS